MNAVIELILVFFGLGFLWWFFILLSGYLDNRRNVRRGRERWGED